MKYVPAIYEFIKEQHINEVSDMYAAVKYNTARQRLGGESAAAVYNKYPNLASHGSGTIYEKEDDDYVITVYKEYQGKKDILRDNIRNATRYLITYIDKTNSLTRYIIVEYNPKNNALTISQKHTVLNHHKQPINLYNDGNAYDEVMLTVPAIYNDIKNNYGADNKYSDYLFDGFKLSQDEFTSMFEDAFDNSGTKSFGYEYTIEMSKETNESRTYKKYVPLLEEFIAAEQNDTFEFPHEDEPMYEFIKRTESQPKINIHDMFTDDELSYLAHKGIETDPRYKNIFIFYQIEDEGVHHIPVGTYDEVRNWLDTKWKDDLIKWINTEDPSKHLSFYHDYGDTDPDESYIAPKKVI